jgi:DNA-binding CsgD family transcriptional regulator
MDLAWARLLGTGCVAGRCQVAGRDGSPRDIIYRGLAHVRPGLQLIAFAPADWLEDGLDATDADRPDPSASLTAREIEVLELTADGRSGPELAQALVLSPSTVSTHFKNIYEKLDVRTRAAAVAKAMRLRVID